MLRWFRKAALLALLLVMPLQGLAWALAPFTCAAVGVEHDMQTTSAHHHHDASHGAADHHHEHSGSGADLGKHLDCHPVFSGAPVACHAALPDEPPVFRGAVSLMATLFIPESPQRPPRS